MILLVWGQRQLQDQLGLRRWCLSRRDLPLPPPPGCGPGVSLGTVYSEGPDLAHGGGKVLLVWRERKGASVYDAQSAVITFGK